MICNIFRSVLRHTLPAQYKSCLNNAVLAMAGMHQNRFALHGHTNSGH